MRDEQKSKPDPRVSVQMPIRISTIDAEIDPRSGRRFFRASSETCANISRSGAFVPTEETLSPGRRLLVELELPGGKTVQRMGRVVWARTGSAPKTPGGSGLVPGIGIEFAEAAGEDIQALERFLARTIQRRGDAEYAWPSSTSSRQS